VVRPLISLIAATAALAGCGNERTPVPDVGTPAEPSASRDVLIEDAGVSFEAPHNWEPLAAQGSRVGGVGSGRATVAVWRYERDEPLPVTHADTRRVAQLLVEQVSERDAGAQLDRPVVDRRRIELRGTQTINDIEVGMRSLHLFGHGAEVVVDAYAPLEQFEKVDETVFRPLLESVQLRRPR
jgi:hypothetical protein